MTLARRSLFVFTAIGCLLASVAAMAADIPLINWAAPAYWSPSSGSGGGRTALTDAAAPMPYIPAVPCRQYDSRSGAVLSDNTPRTVTLIGAPCGIPAAAQAVAANITVLDITGAGSNGVLRVGTVAPPSTSWINYPPTETQRANAGVLPLGAGGTIALQVNQGAGSVDFIVDVFGYYGPAPATATNSFSVINSGFAAIYGETNNTASSASGVVGRATAGSARGVFGQSTSPIDGAAGVVGYAAGLAGVTFGVVGRTDSATNGAIGVSGFASATTGRTFGVLGQTNSATDDSKGVWGFAGATTGVTYGVQGTTNSTTDGAIGVFGDDRGTSGQTCGVLGQTFSTTYAAAGVAGHAGSTTGQAFGVLGVSESLTSGVGVAGALVDTNGNPTVYGVLGSAMGTSADTTGPPWGVFAFGNLGATGTKHFVEPHPSDPAKVVVYSSLEGREVGTYFRGTARVVNHQAVIEVPEDFRIVTDEDGLTVQLTPVGDLATLAVVSQDLNQILVKASKDVTFHYLVQGVRRAFKDLQPVRIGYEFVPRSPNDTMKPFLTEEARRRLIANGTYNADGTVNMNTAERLGWRKIWADRKAAEASAEATTQARAAADSQSQGSR